MGDRFHLLFSFLILKFGYSEQNEKHERQQDYRPDVPGCGSCFSVHSENEGALLKEKDKKKLIEIAKTSVFNKINGKDIPKFEIESEDLKQNCGAFVTLNKNGELRGCIGYIVAEKPLYKTVEEVAVSAALNDPRFPPVTKSELDELEG